MSGKARNTFAGPVRLIVKDSGDGLGFNFGSFWIWKNSDHKYFIKRADDMYYSKTKKWVSRFYTSEKEVLVMMFSSLRTALKVAQKEVKVVDMDFDFTVQLEIEEDEFNRFDLMEF